ncbi:RrF2 family transcriptional regulator [Candidatus Bipolaricaulota bacterium]|nr:RrF2 family transcriptional regulator [Candidatus Bipolaricaulota bacterium]
MRVTKKSGYGLVAMTELAQNFGNSHISTKDIAEKYELPRPFLEKILRELKDAELVEVKRGRGGGYELAEKPKDISVKSVIAVLEESKLAPVNCLLPEENDPCPLEDNCPTLEVWKAIYEKFLDVLRSFTLADLVAYFDEDSTP